MTQDHKNLANSCFVTKVNGFHHVFTDGEGVFEYEVAISVVIFQNEATVNAPAGRKRGGSAHVPYPQ